MSARFVAPAKRLRGTIAVPGDKSISHRSALLNAIADGEAVVHNFLPGDDCLSTLRVLGALGVEHDLDTTQPEPVLRIKGAGLHGLREPDDILDCGNSGTTMRLLSGILAGQPFLSVLTGDASLRSRPMDRVATPLRSMGARVDGRDGGRLPPLTVRGGDLHGISYRSPVASAQVKSCVLLAGLYAQGETTVEEPATTRDHTERMLSAMGARIEREGPAVRLTPPARLDPLSLRAPNDISTAAFWIVAAAAHPDAEVHLTGVGVNPTRSGVIDALRDMGADIALEEERVIGGEPVADIVARSSRLHGTTIVGELTLRAIDELPVLAVAASFAEGETQIRDAQELRVKESDRIAATVSQLRSLGVEARELPDGIVVEGQRRVRGGAVQAFGDHRLAMAFAVAGLASSDGVQLDDATAADISYPDFWEHLARLSG